jgi:catechol 2,3-dioxygenase-like lactoylglutathione lyase family enzyme
MLDHVSLGVRVLPRATAFYRDVLATIGYRVHRETPEEVAFGPGEDWSFFLYPAPGDDAIVGARMHVAFYAADRERVRAFYDAALAAGAQALPDRSPAHRPQFGEHYFGAVLKDPDGHAIEVLSRAPATV